LPWPAPGCVPLLSEPVGDDPAEDDPAAAVAPGFAVPIPVPAGAVEAGSPVTVRFEPSTDAAEGGETGAACSAAAAAPPEPASAGALETGPGTADPDGAPDGVDGGSVGFVEAVSLPWSEMRETATPLATSTTAADAKASHTYAPLSFRSANETTPDPPAQCLPRNVTPPTGQQP
jgi:hypothetical protein